jgi:hypothetical protein
MSRVVQIEARLASKLLFPVFYFILTYLSFYFFNLIRKEDLVTASKIFNIKLIAEYIKSELKK